MSEEEYKRMTCPHCGNNDRRMIKEEPDKNEVLYYSMQGTPVYKRIFKCGQCGKIIPKE